LPFIKKNHVYIWNWIQKSKPKKTLQKRKTKGEFIVDETLLKVNNQFIWVWIAIDSIDNSIDKIILGIHISIERTMLIAERFY